MHHSQFSIEVVFITAPSPFTTLWQERLQFKIFHVGAAKIGCMKDKRLSFLLRPRDDAERISMKWARSFRPRLKPYKTSWPTAPANGTGHVISISFIWIDPKLRAMFVVGS